MAFDWVDAEAKAKLESRLSGRQIRVLGELIEVIEMPEDDVGV